PERLQAAAPNFVRQATQSASQGDTQQAEQQLAIALSWNPKIDLAPDTPETEQNAAQTALKFTALYHRRIGQELAEELKIDEAIQEFEKAIDLDSAIDLNPDTKTIEQDTRAIAQQLSAPGKIIEGRRQVIAGQIQQAIQTYKDAQALNPSFEVKAFDWDFLCRESSLRGGAQQVLDACEKAVSLSPKDESFIDSRGLARALAGNIEGAIADFQYFIEWTTDEEARSQRQEWIDALEAGENPFTPEVLESLQ
ncbi:MAG: hypothetical protein VKL39_20595, partial [Leptolyngbyaceae bacterium]|nr:hypothetical protein [Leptolyngbyaceae bacterium]